MHTCSQNEILSACLTVHAVLSVILCWVEYACKSNTDVHVTHCHTTHLAFKEFQYTFSVAMCSLPVITVLLAASAEMDTVSITQ